MDKSLKNLYFIFVLLFSGLSTVFFRSSEGLITLWTIGFLLFWRQTIKLPKSLIYALAIWLLYFGINSLITKSFHPYFGFTYIAKIMIAYWLISYFGKHIFIRYEKMIYYLAIISLCFFIIQLINHDFLLNIFTKIDLSQDLYSRKFYKSIIIYTINGGEDILFTNRNSGFCWEPGPFSSYIVIAMFFNLVRNKLKFKNKKYLIVYLIAILSTQSTTGLIALLALIIWYAWSGMKTRFYRLFSIPIAIGISILLFTNIPFLQEKIIDESNQDLDQIIQSSSVSGDMMGPGRFASFQLGWIDFLSYPVAGIGGNMELRYAAKKGANVWSPNGFVNILSFYGSIGIILFLYLLFSSGWWYSRYFKFKGYFIFPAIILIISFGFNIIEYPIIFTFLMCSVFFSMDTKKKSLSIKK
jgi:hypothetical protein